MLDAKLTTRPNISIFLPVRAAAQICGAHQCVSAATTKDLALRQSLCRPPVPRRNRVFASLFLFGLPVTSQAQETAAPARAAGAQPDAADLLNFDFGQGTEMLWAAGQRLADLIGRAGSGGIEVQSFFATLASYGFAPYRALVLTAVFVLAGVIVEWVIRRLLRPLENAEKRGSAIALMLAQSFVEICALLSFALIAGVPLLMALSNDPVASACVTTLGPAVMAIRVTEAVLRRLVLPFDAGAAARWVDMDTAAAKRLYSSIVALATLAALFYFSAALIRQGGMHSDVVTGYVLLSRTLVSTGLVLAFFANREGVAHMMRTRRGGLPRSALWQGFSSVWHYIATVYVGLSWLWTSVLILADAPDANRASIQSFVVIMVAVITTLGLDSWVHREQRAPDSELPVFREVISHVGAQAIAAIAFVLLIFVWLPTWDVVPLLSTSPVLRAALIQIAVTLFLAHFVWQLIVLSIQRYTQRQAGEDGAPKTRAETIMPLVRIGILIFLVAVTAVIVMSAVGVDLLPLFAGASIFGLALGLGSQTLVRDVISGMFFLFDDAFRVGEYVDLGVAMGTVEQVSTRSMRLRHHLGTVHTIPYGEIKTVANLSRDWVIYPVEFRVPFDVDPNDLRKKIKALGKELAADELVGFKFIGPLKCQGVVGMEDSTMIMRCKFTTKPGDQFELRRIVYDRLRELLRKEGISIAAREVRVRGGGRREGEIASAAAEMIEADTL